MRTVKLEDLKKLASTIGSDEVLAVSNSELFTAPLSTVLNDYSTQVSLGAYQSDALNLFATKASVSTVSSNLGDTQVSLGNVKVSLGNTQVSLGSVKVSLGSLASRVAAIEQFLAVGSPTYPFIP